MLKTILLVILAILAVTTILLVIRTVIFRRRHRPTAPVERIPVDANLVGEHLAAAVRCKTVPLDDTGTPDPAAFAEFHALLQQLYPRVHACLEREVVNGYSLLYKWRGTKPDLEPVQLMAHQDVVAAEAETLDRWTHPPFDGVIENGVLWGRGTLDIKNQLIGIMEAAEVLLARNFQPERTIHFAFGHDEETGGQRGAKCVGQALKERGVKLAGIVDEGGGIVEGIVPGVKGQVALIGTGEKGYLTLEFTVKCPPGHSSAPPRQTAIGILGRAMARLEEHPPRPHVRSARPMYWALGPAVPLPVQIAFANAWLLGVPLRRWLDRSPEVRAYVRTTTAVTVFHAGDADNTLPPEAKALVNFRLLPHDTIAKVCDHVRKTINDNRVEFKPVEGKANEVVGPSPIDGPAYAGLSRAIREVYGDYPEAPFVMLGGTDCGHYVEVCDAIYRFTPLVMDPSFAGLEHGVDERIPVEAMGTCVQFYARLMQLWGTEKMA